ncbi:MAG: hypothetical protein K6U87_13615 [Firmicutes bacterium]|nr:hypothetical protein [Bacillota bacterium]
MSLLAADDLATGKVTGMVRCRYRSQACIELLQHLDARYPQESKLQSKSPSAHTSRETQAYLAIVPHRFDFGFTSKPGSWLNILEALVAKLTKLPLRGIRGRSVAKLHTCIAQYLDQIHFAPVPFRLEEAPAT